MRYFIVDEFNTENKKLPDVIGNVESEKTIKYAYSFTKSNQFYLTNRRIIFFCQSLLRGKSFNRYFATKSVHTVEITYKNPYGWLVIAGAIAIIGLISAIKSNTGRSNNMFGNGRSDTESGLLLFGLSIVIIQSGVFVLLWYYLRGYYLKFNNGSISGLFCRSREGLEDILRKFDLIKFNESNIINIENVDIVESTRDITCTSCKSVLSLESDDLKSDTFVCPICSTVNLTR